MSAHRVNHVDLAVEMTYAVLVVPLLDALPAVVLLAVLGFPTDFILSTLPVNGHSLLDKDSLCALKVHLAPASPLSLHQIG